MNESETISAAMSILGSRKSERKAAASRENGKRGGRPNAAQRALHLKRSLAGKVKGNSANRRKARRSVK